MNLYVFRSEKQPDVFGFTADKSGDNLPRELTPWTKRQDYEMFARGDDASASRIVAESIDCEGFFVARSETLSRLTGVTWVA